MISHQLKKFAAVFALMSAGAAIATGERVVLVGHTELYVPTAPGYTDTKLMPDGEKEETVRIEPDAQLVSMQVRHGEMESYILVKTPRDMADQRLSLDDFLKITSQTKASRSTLANFADYANKSAKGREHEVEEAIGQKIDKLRFGQLALLHRGRDDDDASGYTAAWKADMDTDGQHVVAKFLLCTYVARVKEKLLFIQVHAPQLKTGDYKWVSDVCDRYVDDFVAINKLERLKRLLPRPVGEAALPSGVAAQE